MSVPQIAQDTSGHSTTPADAREAAYGGSQPATGASLAGRLPALGPADPHRAPHLSSEDRARLLRAAHDVTALYPGAIGELVRGELVSWREFGFRLDQHGLAMRVAAAVEDEQRRRQQRGGAR